MRENDFLLLFSVENEAVYLNELRATPTSPSATSGQAGYEKTAINKGMRKKSIILFKSYNTNDNFGLNQWEIQRKYLD